MSRCRNICDNTHLRVLCDWMTDRGRRVKVNLSDGPVRGSEGWRISEQVRTGVNVDEPMAFYLKVVHVYCTISTECSQHVTRDAREHYLRLQSSQATFSRDRHQKCSFCAK